MSDLEKTPLGKWEDLLNVNGKTRPAAGEVRARKVEILIVGPEAGTIAAGLTIAMTRLATDIEDRHPKVKVTVNAQ